FKKFLKKSIKWLLFLLVSSHIAHSITAYFVGANELFWITTESPTKNWGLFIFVQIFTGILLFDFGWFREQFCIIMCPYGRFQSVLMDQTSMAPMYDEKRGEPRRGKGVENPGDCIDCFKCVAVCPTGIDIRGGLQMECIACTACMDACDEVMEKTSKPKGLIRYSSMEQMEGKTKKWSGRSFAYLALYAILVSGFIFALTSRKDIEFKVIRALESPYKVQAHDNQKVVTNHFKIHLTNQSQGPINLEKLTSELAELEFVAPTLPMTVEPGQKVWIHFFTKFPLSYTLGVGTKPTAMELPFTDKNGEQKKLDLSVDLLGPAKE
ncbi:MAG: 4Fe-4S dicluster domain-containing protein, partial [Bdellovibrionales bacterium]|nr:4Fe-4S dicluster domain-containing protein [Bdellovibrionales bacterium]